MKLINADKIQEEIKECNRFFAYDDYDKGMREGIRRALMRISEAKTVNIEEIRAEAIKEFAEKVIHRINEHLTEPNYQHEEEDWANGLIIAKDDIDTILSEYEKEQK